jgi:hypothetical protein
MALAGIRRVNRAGPSRGRCWAVRRRILRWTVRQLDRVTPLVRDVGRAAMFPGMRRVTGMGVHRVTLGSGGVVQGRCLNGGGGGGGEREGENGKPNREFHSK